MAISCFCSFVVNDQMKRPPCATSSSDFQKVDSNGSGLLATSVEARKRRVGSSGIVASARTISKTKETLNAGKLT